MEIEILVIALVCVVVGWASHASTLMKRNHELFVTACVACMQRDAACEALAIQQKEVSE